MEVKKSALNNIVIAIVIVVVLLGGFLLFSNKPASNEQSNVNSVSTSGDKQIIDLTAKVGYTPSTITAKAEKETILRVSTNETFDCSSGLRIPSLNISKNLPATGQTEIALGSQKAGTVIDGTCTMGMYSFKIKFS